MTFVFVHESERIAVAEGRLPLRRATLITLPARPRQRRRMRLPRMTASQAAVAITMAYSLAVACFLL